MQSIGGGSTPGGAPPPVFVTHLALGRKTKHLVGVHLDLTASEGNPSPVSFTQNQALLSVRELHFTRIDLRTVSRDRKNRTSDRDLMRRKLP